MKKFFATILAVLMFLSTGAYATESLKSDLGMIQKKVKALHLTTAQKHKLARAIKHRDMATAKAMLKLSSHDVKVLQKAGKQHMMKLSQADKQKLFGSKAVNAKVLSHQKMQETEGANWAAVAIAVGVAATAGCIVWSNWGTIKNGWVGSAIGSW